MTVVNETDVLVVGAGPSGASAGVLLASYGVSCIVVNKYSACSPTPRAHITNQRAVEVFRDMGLESEMVAVATPQRLMGEHVFARSLAGREFGRLRTWYTDPHFKAEHDLASPCSICDIPQDILEPILVNAAASRGTTVRFNTEFVSLRQDVDGVTSVLRDRLTGGEFEIRSKYVIGADGANSAVVKQLELPLEGKMGLRGSINVVFKADLSRFVEHRPGDMYWFFQPGVGVNGVGVGVLRMVRTWWRWVGVWGFDINGPKPDLSHEFGRKIAHQLIGDDSVPVEIESMSTWTTNDVYAKDNMLGRVFCVGDAVHRHPPMNGLGSNTSIQDSFNLCWKLAMVLRGEAAPSLLETYRDERVPVGKQIVRRANDSMGLLPPVFGALGVSTVPDAAGFEAALAVLDEDSPRGVSRRSELRGAMDGLLRGYSTLGVELQQHYQSAAVVSDGAPLPEWSRDAEFYYNATSRPGYHLPHVWLTKDQKRVSTLDLCGKGRFTLLTGHSGAKAWNAAAHQAREKLGISLEVRVIGYGCAYDDCYGDYARLREVNDDGALLVRPDLMVGWRSHTAGTDSVAALINALSQILGRT